MESRRPLRQSNNGKSGMVSHRSIVDLSRLPLLPFERELVATLGCSEAEYRAFTVEAMKRARVRPAEYDHIPEINAILPAAGAAAAAALSAGAAAKSATTVFLVNLAVGLALSAISFLLTPKPKQPGQTESRQLPSVTGADRFGTTSGFDTQAELANYGDPIPIIFGQYTGATGGILAAPSLVWSRAFSYGSQQGVKLLFVVGEQGLGEGINRPDLNGIFLGNSALDAIYAHNFAFYWKRNTNTFSRIRAQNLAYGTRGDQSSGDTQTPDDIFLCQTIEGQSQPGFCQVYTPSANTQFGVYSAVPNGTDYRVNWRLVPIPNVPDVIAKDEDPKSQKLLERVKVAGDYDLPIKAAHTSAPGAFSTGGASELRRAGQKGTGRGYGRRMGITSLNGQPVTTGETEVRQAAVGDIAIFTIAPGALPEALYYFTSSKGKIFEGTKVDDINSEITAGRRNADELLQLGETVMIGRTTWVVESRTLPEWKENTRQSIGLRCIETFGSGLGASIGLISEKMITRGVYSDDLGTTNARNGLGLHAGAGFYPLMRVAFGVVRNSRDCEVTEIGLRSQVWNRANGLCNFEGLPSVAAFVEAEQGNVAIESGVMTLYLKRTSVWTIWLRPSGTDESGVEYAWQPLGEQFCVTGETPQDQFNFIRITHPQRGRYEFKMVPKSGADVARHSPDDAVFWRLNAKTRNSLAASYETPYGAFQVLVIGDLVTKAGVSFNPELLSQASISDGTTATSIPNAIEVESYLPDEDSASAKAVSVDWYDWLPDDVSEGRRGATHYELFGQASSTGLVKTAQRTANLGDGRSITIKFTGIVDDAYPASHPYFPGFRAWSFQSIDVVSSTGGFNTSQIFNVSIPVTPGNPRAAPYGLTTCGVRLIVLRTSTAVQPLGRESAWEYEILGSAQLLPLAATKTVTFAADSNSGGNTVIVAKGLVTARPADSLANFPGQTQAWDVSYTIDPDQTFGNWQNGALIDNNAVVSAGNPFKPAGSTVGILLRVLSLQSVVTPPGFIAERTFERNSQLNDISFYNSLLTKSNESAPEHEIMYVNEMVSNPTAPQYDKLTITGLALKASRNFASLNQLRVWLADGISVERFQSGASGVGPSNKFTDLVYHLLTDKVAGAGNIVSPSLIDTDKFPATSQFLEQNKLFFDGAIDQPTNVRQFISDIAPFFLCNFVISNGRFSIIPAVPADLTGSVSDGPVQIQQLFTSGNIIEDSFSVEYLSTEERKNFQAVVRYRTAQRNQFPEEQTLVVRWSDLPESTTVETFDMTQYCTSRQHAFMAAKYFLSLRRRVTHTIKLRTTPYGLSLAPGDYIRVLTQSSPYNAANNGVVDSNLNITAVTPLSDGAYMVSYWNASFNEVQPETMTVAGGKAVEPKFADAIFTIVDATVSSGTYMVEQLTLSEDGLVDIVAVEFPTTSSLNSLIALDLLDDAAFTTEG